MRDLEKHSIFQVSHYYNKILLLNQLKYNNLLINIIILLKLLQSSTAIAIMRHYHKKVFLYNLIFKY